MSPTCQYSDAAPAPSSWASLRMLRPCEAVAVEQRQRRVDDRVARQRAALAAAAPRACATTEVPVRRALTRTLYCARTVFEMTRTVFDPHNAIEAHGLVKTLSGDVRALDGLDLDGRGRARSSACSAPTAPASPRPSGSSPRSPRPTPGARAWPASTCCAEPVRVRRAIGVVGQKHGADRDATGRENLVLQGELYGITGAELRRRVAESLERFGLADAADRQVKTYSGGMQRRLDVAMGLIHRPQVLFLDEPTTGLDPEARAQMWAEIERLAREEGMTILLTTHYLEEADRLASQLAIVDRGRIVARGTPDELKAELQGDAIQVELADGDGAGRRGARSSACPGCATCSLDGRTLRARAPTAARARSPPCSPRWRPTACARAAVTLARPSLDDVYLRHAGRAFHQPTLRTDGGMTAFARPGRSPCATCACCCASPRSSSSRSCSR